MKSAGAPFPSSCQQKDMRMTDAPMPDHIRIPHTFPYWADDVPPEDDILPYTMPQLEAAGQRAVRWRVHCARVAGANSEILNGIAFTSKPEELRMPDREGWMCIGWVADPWVGGGLRVVWKPSSDQVRMDRPPPRKGHHGRMRNGGSR